MVIFFRFLWFENKSTELWEFDFKLNKYSYLNFPIEIVITATTEVEYSSKKYEIKTYNNFSMILEDRAPPRILEVYQIINNENKPLSITFYAEIQEFGTGISNVNLSYRSHIVD